MTLSYKYTINYFTKICPVFICVFLIGATGCQTTSQFSANSTVIPTRNLPEAHQCFIYEPPDTLQYSQLPVVILLGNRTHRSNFFERSNTIAQLHEWMTQGLIPPALLVVPESRDGLWWNYFDQSHMYADYLVNDLIPELQKKYSVAANSRHHHVFGIGTGAMGAVEMSSLYTGSFGTVGALNGYYFDSAGAPNYIRQHPFQNSRQIFGPPENQLAMNARSIYKHIQKSSNVEGTRFFLGFCGSDGWDIIQSNTLFQEHLMHLGISHDIINFYGAMSRQTTIKMIPVFIALQLGLQEIYGEIDDVSWQVLRHR